MDGFIDIVFTFILAVIFFTEFGVKWTLLHDAEKFYLTNKGGSTDPLIVEHIVRTASIYRQQLMGFDYGIWFWLLVIIAIIGCLMANLPITAGLLALSQLGRSILFIVSDKTIRGLHDIASQHWA